MYNVALILVNEHELSSRGTAATGLNKFFLLQGPQHSSCDED